jgi:hypothetical protein
MSLLGEMPDHVRGGVYMRLRNVYYVVSKNITVTSVDKYIN